MNMYDLFKIGDEIDGFCNAYFGRDNYLHKTCVQVTRKYAVFEYKDGEASVLNFSELGNFADMTIKEQVDEWKKEAEKSDEE